MSWKNCRTTTVKSTGTELLPHHNYSPTIYKQFMDFILNNIRRTDHVIIIHKKCNKETVLTREYCSTMNPSADCTLTPVSAVVHA